MTTQISKKIVNEFIGDFEARLKSILNTCGYKNLNDYVNSRTEDPKQKTVEKTKLIACFYENSFKDVCKKNGLQVGSKSADGYDIIIDDVEYEMKLTLSLNDNWTGNSFSQVKVKKLILIKVDINDNNQIDKIFFGILDSQNSNWKHSTNGKNNAAFSNLTISKDDIDNLQIIYGDCRIKRAGSKNLGIILENFQR